MNYFFFFFAAFLTGFFAAFFFVAILRFTSLQWREAREHFK
jgi:hypothetical protein